MNCFEIGEIFFLFLIVTSVMGLFIYMSRRENSELEDANAELLEENLELEKKIEVLRAELEGKRIKNMPYQEIIRYLTETE